MAWVLLGALALGVLGACSSLEGEDDGGDAPTETERQDTATPSEPSATDEPGELPEGLATILDRVAELRELEAPPDLDAELVTRSDLPALLASILTDEDMEYFAELTTVYRLLGYLENDQDYYDVYTSFGATGILGFYAPNEKKLWVVVEDGETLDWEDLGRQAEETLAHEIVHFLQDYHFDIGQTSLEIGTDLDRGLAYTSVVEGDASAHDALYGEEYLSVLPLRSAGGVMFLRGNFAQGVDVPAPILREIFFPYQQGAQFIANVREEYGTERINELLEEPLKASAYVLHPELFDDGWEPEQVTLPDFAGEFGPGWEEESAGQFGEFAIMNYLRQDLIRSEAEDAATGWAGDAYQVYRDGEESVAVFRLVFANGEEADEFAELHTAYLEGVGEGLDSGLAGGRRFYEMADGDVVATVELGGREVAFAIATSVELAETAAAALE
ncbi:MAG: hypothetical protein WEC33_03380 [Dehalococcoidia bacterium]